MVPLGEVLSLAFTVSATMVRPKWENLDFYGPIIYICGNYTL